jgi:hypothetical protein
MAQPDERKARPASGGKNTADEDADAFAGQVIAACTTLAASAGSLSRAKCVGGRSRQCGGAGQRGF